MTFRNLYLKETYDSDEDDILNDFYIPTLSNSIRYDRLAGYFSSTALAVSAKGMAQFLQNGGKMRLVTSVQLSREDYRAVKKGLAEPEELVSRIMEEKLDTADRLAKDHVSALAWMLAKNNLEIKIAVPLASDGGYYTGALDQSSVFHQKIGILYDDDHNVVSFGGSVNETGKAWHDNIEEFKIFCSWKAGQDIYLSNDTRKFEKFWYGRSTRTRVFDLPTAVRKRLIRSAPDTESEAVARIMGRAQIEPELRYYQKDAVDRWFANNMRGIFEMATGTGKTRAAISCIKRVLSDPATEHTLIVITCPYIHLVTQWTNELRKWNIEGRKAYAQSTSWMVDLGDRVLYLNDGVLKNLVIVTTHNTFSGEKFTAMIKSCKTRALVIADEVHKIGAEKNLEGLLDTYDYRLGLSATPERYFDEEGTTTLLDFFGGVIYRFGLDEAIQRGYLVHYLLFPHAVYMTEDESSQYHGYSLRIAIEATKDLPDHDKILLLSIKRSNIIKAARNKLKKLREILVENSELDHSLVYCAGEQLEDAASILHDSGVVFHRFTFRESNEERAKLLNEFDAGDKDVLLAVRCLDEGVDVPSTKTAIILASSRNPIEFIQRRGRILRPHTGKKRAAIHDLIVLPTSLPTNEIYTESEKTIIRNELSRLEEFACSSDNPEYSRQLIQILMNKYNL